MAFLARPSARQRPKRWAPAALLSAAVGAAATVALAGCGGQAANAAVDDSQKVAATVEAFDRAAVRGDFKTICNNLFTANARAAAGGPDCPKQLASGGASLAGTQFRLNSIVLQGDNATATITATKSGAPPAVETLVLVRVAKAFKIESATGPPDE